MKYLLFFAVLLSIDARAQGGTVVLKISGIDPTLGGEVTAGLFLKENFPVVGKSSFGDVVAALAPAVELTLTGVPPGDYGIAAFHDIDRDKKLKTNVVGFPKEPIGFSNNAKIVFGPPSFEDARITVKANETILLSITLR